MCESVYHAAAASSAAPMSFETAITIVLAALTAILTALAIGIGVAAIWGYGGLKESLNNMATKRVDEAMLAKLKEYPEAAEILDLTQRLRSRLDFLDQVQNQIDTVYESKPVEKASISGIKGTTAVPAAAPATQVSPEQKIAVPEPYPGEEQPHASGAGKTPDSPAGNADPRPDNNKVSGPSSG